LSEPRGPVTGTLVTHGVVSTDSVASILSGFHNAGRLYCPSSTCQAGVQQEGHRSLAATDFTTGSTYSNLLHFKGGAGEQERPPQQPKVARLSPLQVHCCISLLQRRVRMKAVQKTRLKRGEYG